MLKNDFGVTTLESVGMAKKKAAVRSSQKLLVSYKADPQTFDAYKSWLDGFAEDIGVPITSLFDIAMKELAKQRGYTPPPKRLAK